MTQQFPLFRVKAKQIAWLFLFLLLTACQTTTPTAVPPTAILPTPQVLSTAVPLPTNTNAPTLPPPVIASPIPTTDGQPTPSAATAVPQPTLVIEGLVGPTNFPPNVNPLTGEVVTNPAVLARRPLAIKVSNAPAIVRPQSGLNNADLVFEHYAEGGLTRFTAVFYSKDAPTVGSVRSARLIDLEIPKMYDAAFAYSGSSGPVRQMIHDSEFFDRVISPDFGHGGFFRVEDPNKAFEHTLFTNTDNLRFILQERGLDTAPQFQNGMAFSPAPATVGQPATTIEVRYDGSDATWSYNAASGRYFRWTDGVVHTDANTGEQLNFKNIIVLGAHHENSTILEDLVAGGHYSIQIQIWGEGPVSIFRDGQRFDGRWQRNDPNDMLTFYDLNGNLLPLAPGNSFIQLVPLGFDKLTVTP